MPAESKAQKRAAASTKEKGLPAQAKAPESYNRKLTKHLFGKD